LWGNLRVLWLGAEDVYCGLEDGDPSVELFGGLVVVPGFLGGAGCDVMLAGLFLPDYGLHLEDLDGFGEIRHEGLLKLEEEKMKPPMDAEKRRRKKRF
jgi:hypothetical protein